MTSNNNKTTKTVLVRFVFYTLAFFGLTGSLPLIISNGDISAFLENGPIEWLQFTLFACSTCILLVFSRSEECKTRDVFAVLMVLTTLAMIREMDSILDKWIPIAGWKLPGFICVTAGVIFYLRKRDVLASQIDAFINTRAFSLLWCGFIVAVPFAQLVGHGGFLRLLMGDDYNHYYKRFIEELGELAGYLLIFIGCIEAVLQQKESGNSGSAKSDT